MKEMTCSFCGRSSREVSMIPGADGNICVDCVRHANEMVERHAKQANAAPDLPPTPTPRAIKEFLDQYVIGHEETKKVLSVAVHNHYRRLEAAQARNGKDGGSGTSAPRSADKFADGGWRLRMAGRGGVDAERRCGFDCVAGGAEPDSGCAGGERADGGGVLRARA